MKVKELKKMIENLPDDADIATLFSQYNGWEDESSLEEVEIVFAQFSHVGGYLKDIRFEQTLIFYPEGKLEYLDEFYQEKDLIKLKDL